MKNQKKENVFDEENVLYFRPHHFLCTLCYRGEGYSQYFTEKYTALTERLRDERGGSSTIIRVVDGADSICSFCPNMKDECLTEDKVSLLDLEHGKLLDLSPGQIITWGEARQRIISLISPEDFNRICEPCGWKEMGICLKALKEEQ